MSETRTAPTGTLALIPYGTDPLRGLARRLLEHEADTLPQLTGCCVLLPDPATGRVFRERLLEEAQRHGHTALIGPEVLTLQGWLDRNAPVAKNGLNNYSRELLLVEALRPHAALFQGGNLWAIAASLLALFDQLTLNRIEIPDGLDDFTRQLHRGLAQHEALRSAMERESYLVHTLWRAWQEQLQALGVSDAPQRHLLQLGASLERPDTRRLYLAGFQPRERSELEWLAALGERLPTTLLVQGEGVDMGEAEGELPHPGQPLARLVTRLGWPVTDESQAIAPAAALFYRTLFPADPATALFYRTLFPADPATQPQLAERARQFAENHPQSPIAETLTLFDAHGAEQEAHAIELMIRHWLHRGHRRVGVVCDNRKLSRRLRALLERSAIPVEDTSGWALSTTSAAAVVERLLECVEESFPHVALLDLLKSPFLHLEGLGREALLPLVYHFEQEIVHQEGIARGIDNYRHALASRKGRLEARLGEYLPRIDALLERLHEAARPLRRLCTGEARPLGDYFRALRATLTALGMEATLAEDEAGGRLLDELETMHNSIGPDLQPLDWQAFRAWLGNNLERYNFIPPGNGGILFTALEGSRLLHFDALVIASAEPESLPGAPAPSPFFNDRIRGQLGIPTAAERLGERFHLFRRLLQGGDEVLITRRVEQDGEPLPASPWLELLQSFHRLAYGSDLLHPWLGEAVRRPELEQVDRSAPLPEPRSGAAAAIPPALQPEALSASGYQQLIDCPFQYLCARILGLSPPEPIREMLEKGDFGGRVHRILEAFHSDCPGLPGPFNGQLTEARRDEAIALLEAISTQVFAEDLADHFLHRGWLERWRAAIPAYIDWQGRREEGWRPHATEQRRERLVADPPLRLNGRLDRLDRTLGGDGIAIVDYKTGRSAREEELLSGESVQLPFYALLLEGAESASRSEFLTIEREKVKSGAVLEGETLEEIAAANLERIVALRRDMADGVPLRAWGDEKSCGYCKMSGVCRRDEWLT